jgi:hypothetical protein
VITDYTDFELAASDVQRDPIGIRQLSVRVGGSPREPVVQQVPEAVSGQLTGLLRALDQGVLDAADVVGLGEALGDLLFPDPVRELLVRSLDTLGPNGGLRIRLRLDPQLAPVPWEFVHLARQSGQRDATGFLVLDPRISIVRDEDVTGARPRDETVRERRVIVALASPTTPGYAVLKLDEERANIKAALRGLRGVKAEYVDGATLDTLTAALDGGSFDIFHFAGHGSEDALILQGSSPDARPTELAGEQLAVNMLSRGAQLAVLGACDSGLRNAQDAWSGIATRLIGAGVGAAVAMQYRIGDRNAIAFGKALYGGLASGVSIDEAAAAGRIAVFNRMHPKRDDPRLAGLWRDWGVPVLYLRKGATVSLASIVDPKARETARAKATVILDDRIGTLAPTGTYRGVVAGVLRSGGIKARLRAGELAGESTLVKLGRAEAGTTVDSRTDAKVISGKHVGVEIDEIG